MAYRRKDEDEKFVPVTVSFDPKDKERLIKFCQEEERAMSWVIRKALDAYLSERGY